MKTKSGFVSNSSSSSFIVRGIEIKVKKLLRLFGLKKPKRNKQNELWGCEDETFELLNEYVSERMNPLSIEKTIRDDGYTECDSVVIGMTWGDMGDGSVESINIEEKMEDDDENIIDKLNRNNVKVTKKDLRLHIFYSSGG